MSESTTTCTLWKVQKKSFYFYVLNIADMQLILANTESVGCSAAGWCRPGHATLGPPIKPALVRQEVRTLTPAFQTKRGWGGHVPQQRLQLQAPTLHPRPFTLHFTADIISQISVHLVRILTHFDGPREKKVTPSCCEPPFH